MEQDCTAALQQVLSTTAGAEFSSEDVSLLFSKVFHTSCSSSEALAAMKKVAPHDDSSWSCAGGNVLDVLLEMETEMERKEMLLWELQLLNSGNSQLKMDSWEQSLLPKYPRSSEVVVEQPLISKMKEARSREKELFNKATSVRKLKKAGGHTWAWLASEGIQSILPFPQQIHALPLAQAWGCVTFSDVLILVEVKYDVVKQLLFTEMLQEHHSRDGVWEELLPWQKQKEVEKLEELAEEALESADMFCLAMLPGASRIYKICLDTDDCPEVGEEFRSAVCLLNEIQVLCQQEQDSLTSLVQRLGSADPLLLCLHIRLATLEAKREKSSYRSLLAAQQSWETWPEVGRPGRAKLTALWIHDEMEEEELEALQQKAALQLLVLTQQQETKQLVRLVHNVMQGSATDSDRAALGKACVVVHGRQQAHNKNWTPSSQTNPQSGPGEAFPELQLEEWILPLLTHLAELQQSQTLTLLRAITSRDTHSITALREKYLDEIQTQRYSNLLHLLDPDRMQVPYSNSINNGSREHKVRARSAEEENMGASGTSKKGQATEAADNQEVCSGCGAVIEELPYLEISSSQNVQSNLHRDEILCEIEEERSETLSSDGLENQGNLIPLAWSKLSVADTTCEVGAAGEISLQSGNDDIAQVIPAGNREENREAVPKCVTSDCDIAPAEQKGSSTNQAIADEATASKSKQQTHDVDGKRCQGDLSLSRSATNAPKELPRDETESDFRAEDTLLYEEKERSLFEDKPVEELTPTERQWQTEPVSLMEREKTMRNLVDIHKKLEQKQQRGRERQLLRLQERLSIIQNRKAEGDLLGIKHTDSLRRLTEELSVESKNQQRVVVRERLEQVRRERSNLMQSKRDRNTTGFQELLAPVVYGDVEKEAD